MVLPLKIFSSSPAELESSSIIFGLKPEPPRGCYFYIFPIILHWQCGQSAFLSQVAKTLAKVTKNWRSLPLPWVTSQKFQVTLGDLGVTIFVNTFITVTWSHGWTRKPTQLHPPSYLSHLSLSLGGLFRSERWMTFARWVRTKPFVRRITWIFKAGEILKSFKSNPHKSSNIFHHSKEHMCPCTNLLCVCLLLILWQTWNDSRDNTYCCIGFSYLLW